MWIKDLQDCDEITAGDNTSLRELLHPDKSGLKIRYSLAHAVVKSGQSSQLHALAISEVYYILEGEGKMHIDDESAHMHSGQAVYIPPKAKQFIENTGTVDLKFFMHCRSGVAERR